VEKDKFFKKESSMKAFVTGGTGFIGRHVIRKLLNRDYEVTALVRSDQGAAALQALSVNPTRGDILERESMRAGMQDSDVVFHLAGWYKIGDPNPAKGERINVNGTRNVLELAHELGIPKIIYTSTVAVFGDTRGRLVNENYIMAEEPFISQYDRTKWLAHYAIALPLIEKGAPIIIVMPGGVYGPGDPSLVGELMRRFYLGQFPILPGADFKYTYAHVEDVAEGHLLAAEKGKPGESYILAGPAITLLDTTRIWADITGKPAPFLTIPASFLQPFAPLVGPLSKIIPIPSIFSEEAIKILGASYTARSDKAHAELGWEPRSLREGFQETFESVAKGLPESGPAPLVRRQTAGIALGAALGLLIVWLLVRRRRT
jgi:dihydroflavonol-4-reductase